MAKRVLVGIDFIGSNFPAALYTIQQWWNYTNRSDDYVCMLGLSNFCDRHAPLPGAHHLRPSDVVKVLTSFIPEEQVVQWTSDIDAGLLDKVKRNGCQSQPFYSDFNYGSIVNRLLLLASSHGCDYLVRVDPGTLPPKSTSGSAFTELMREHEDEIGADPCTVVSRQYADRLALRDTFVKEGQEGHHADKVREFTGIDVYKQVTGGAMLTFKTPGTPAVCFPPGSGGTLVWASDDGIYRVLPETKRSSRMLREHPVERFDAVGKRKESLEYYRGILGAVYLNAIRNGKSRDVAEQDVDTFIGELKKEVLDADKCTQLDGDRNWSTTFCRENIAPRPFLDAIATGCQNHVALIREWGKICTVLKPSVVDETNANNRVGRVR